MKISAIIFASATAISVTQEGVEDANMHVHVVSSSDGPVDQWLFIDAIIDHDDDHDHN